MKKQLMDFEVEEVVGGTVCLSASIKVVGFSQLGKTFRMKGDYKAMRNRLFELQDENENMNAKEFDTLVMNDFKAKGWI